MGGVGGRLSEGGVDWGRECVTVCVSVNVSVCECVN